MFKNNLVTIGMFFMVVLLLGCGSNTSNDSSAISEDTLVGLEEDETKKSDYLKQFNKIKFSKELIEGKTFYKASNPSLLATLYYHNDFLNSYQKIEFGKEFCVVYNDAGFIFGGDLWRQAATYKYSVTDSGFLLIEAEVKDKAFEETFEVLLKISEQNITNFTSDVLVNGRKYGTNIFFENNADGVDYYAKRDRIYANFNISNPCAPIVDLPCKVTITDASINAFPFVGKYADFLDTGGKFLNFSDEPSSTVGSFINQPITHEFDKEGTYVINYTVQTEDNVDFKISKEIVVSKIKKKRPPCVTIPMYSNGISKNGFELIGDKNYKWSNGSILKYAIDFGNYTKNDFSLYCDAFDSESSCQNKIINLIQVYASKWNAGLDTQIFFEYTSNWNNSQIRIAFDKGEGFNSKIGTYANEFIGKKTMNLDIEGFEKVVQGVDELDEDYLRKINYYKESVEGTIIHEFGHAVGLLHEHKRVDSPLMYVDNYIQNVADQQNWTFAYAEHNLEKTLYANGNAYKDTSTEYDTNSIMHYYVYREDVTNPGVCPEPLSQNDGLFCINKNNYLSVLDKIGIQRMYPKIVPPPPPSITGLDIEVQNADFNHRCTSEYAVIDKDLNEGVSKSSGWFGNAFSKVPELKLCYTKTKNALHPEPITDIKTIKGGKSSIKCPSGYKKHSRYDLNKGAGGDYIYMCTTTNKLYTKIKSVEIVSYPFQADFLCSNNSGVDLNAGAGGNYIYLCYERVSPLDE